MQVESQALHTLGKTRSLEKTRNDRNNLLRGAWQYVKVNRCCLLRFPVSRNILSDISSSKLVSRAHSEYRRA